MILKLLKYKMPWKNKKRIPKNLLLYNEMKIMFRITQVISWNIIKYKFLKFHIIYL